MASLSRALLRLIGLRREEFLRALPMALSHASLLAALYVLKPARNALFLERLGVERLPWVLLAVAGMGAAVALLFAKWLHRTALERVVPVCLFGFAFTTVAFHRGLDQERPGLVFAFYLTVNLFGQLSTSLLWLWANASFDTREARRVFGFMAASGIAGAFVGGCTTQGLVDLVGTRDLLLLGALWTTFAALVSLRRSPSGVPAAPSVPERMSIELRSSPLVRRLAMWACLAAATSALVDLQFNALVDEAFPDEDSKTAFFGGFFAWLNAGAFAFQLLAAPRFLARLGIGPSVLLLPLALTLGSVGVVFVPTLLFGVMLKSADGGLRHSLNRSVMEILFVPLPAGVRRRARVLLDATFDNLGTGLGAGLGLVLLSRFEPRIPALSFGILGLLGLWMWVAMRLRPAYLDALKRGLQHREIHPEELKRELGARAHRDTLLASLSGGNLRAVHYALDALISEQAKDVQAAVVPLLRHSDAVVRRKALALLGLQSSDELRAWAASLLDDSDPDVRTEAMRLFSSCDPSPTRRLQEYLDSDDPLRWHAALSCTLELPFTQARDLLSSAVVARVRQFGGPQGPETRAQLVRALAHVDVESSVLLSFIDAGESVVTNRVLEALGDLRDPRSIPTLVTHLGDRRTRPAAAAALIRQGSAALPALQEVLLAIDSTAQTAASRILAAQGERAARRTLFDALFLLPPFRRGPILAACAKLRRRDASIRFPSRRVATLLDSELDYLRQLSMLEASLPAKGRPRELLSRALREKNDESRVRVVHTLALRQSSEDMRAVEIGLRSSESGSRARAMELLDESLHADDRARILPLMEREARKPGAALSESECFAWLLEAGDGWLQACALFAARSFPPAFGDRIRRLCDSEDSRVREMARYALEHGQGAQQGVLL